MIWSGSGEKVTVPSGLTAEAKANFTLVNGVDYYVMVAMVDKAGQKTYSDEKPITIPEHNDEPQFIKDIENIEMWEDTTHEIILSEHFWDAPERMPARYGRQQQRSKQRR